MLKNILCSYCLQRIFQIQNQLSEISCVLGVIRIIRK